MVATLARVVVGIRRGSVAMGGVCGVAPASACVEDEGCRVNRNGAGVLFTLVSHKNRIRRVVRTEWLT